MAETATDTHSNRATDVPKTWEIGGTIVCKSLQAWQAQFLPFGKAIPRLKNERLKLFIINKMQLSINVTLRVALAHRLLPYSANTHGHYTTGVEQFGGFTSSVTCTGSRRADGKRAFGNHLPSEQIRAPRRGLLPGMRWLEFFPLVREWTHP